jgi:hypothetical protein
MPVFDAVTTKAVEAFSEYLYLGHFANMEASLLPAVIALCAVFGIAEEHLETLIAMISPEAAGNPHTFRWRRQF